MLMQIRKHLFEGNLSTKKIMMDSFQEIPFIFAGLLQPTRLTCVAMQLLLLLLYYITS